MRSLKSSERVLVGRAEELSHLESFYKMRDSKLLVMYGRRRVGKSFLLKKFVVQKSFFYFEGLEGGVLKDQLKQVANQLFIQTNDPLLRGFNPNNWIDFFNTLLTVIRNKKGQKKVVIVLDEIQWMASGRTALISILKSFWDNQFLNENVLLILCGSVAHYIVKKVIKSKALYGRISSQMLIQPLKPQEARQMISKRGDLEAIKYLLLFGGIPKYLEEINSNISFDENIENLCFRSTGFFYGEMDKIFFSQFREVKTYQKIIELLSNESLSLEDLSKKLKIRSGGGLKDYLVNLEMAHFIKPNSAILNMNKKRVTYRTVDEYLRFYNHFIKKWETVISQSENKNIFKNHIKPVWNSWFGLAFENFCNKNAYSLAKKMGFQDQVLKSGSLIIKEKSAIRAQYDLAYERKDGVITLCEIKWSESKIDTKVISDFERKLIRTPFPTHLTIEKVLIAPMGGTKALIATNYFTHIITLKDLV